MLSKDHVYVICAALQFWQEEMGPHGEEPIGAYFPDGVGRSLTVQELGELRGWLLDCKVRYGVLSGNRDQLDSRNLYESTEDAAKNAARDNQVVAVLMPALRE